MARIPNVALSRYAQYLRGLLPGGNWAALALEATESTLNQAVGAVNANAPAPGPAVADVSIVVGGRIVRLPFAKRK